MNQTHLMRRIAWTVLGIAMFAALSDAAWSAVGRSEAAYGVTPNGVASYAIPIRATEGINGMTPRLSINYAGPGSRSIFGVGFALGGISYITPCRKTIAQDLNAAPVTLTATDRYCLDGARLRLVDSQAIYGATNTQYRTELDQMVRVVSKGSINNIPSWFRVDMPDGLAYEYGNSTDSKLMSSAQAGATPQFWAVSKISDPFGNAIVFTYDTDAATQRFRPSVISYTERGGAGNYKISFVYQTIVQLTPRYFFTPSAVGGAAHKEDKLLDRIELKHDDVKYRAYKFTYEPGAGDNERLDQVQECAYDPSEDCLPATQFSWQSATAGHAAIATTGKTVASGVMPLDVNGDGIEDLVWAASGTWRYMLGGASGFGAIVNTSVAATNPSKAMPLEWNGDGFWDLLIDWSDGKWRVLRGGASGFNNTVVAAGPGGIPSNTANTAWAIADVDADARDDLVSVPLNAALTVNVRFNGANGFGANQQVFVDQFVHTKASNPFIPMNGASSAIRRPDFNGDGRTDLLIYGCVWETEPPGSCITDRWFQVLSQGSTFTNEGPMPSAAFTIHVRYGDFNGDGLTDAIYPATTGVWNLGFGQGSGGFSIVSGPSSAAHVTYQTLTGDYDGDGLDDFYATKTSPNQWEVFRSTGTALAASPIATTISGSGAGWMLQDQNGDSLPDIGRHDSGTPVWKLGTHLGLPSERLLTATDGLANTVTFAYLPMTSSTVYAKGTGALFPEREYRGNTPLVRTMQVSPGGGSSYAFTYKYANARIHGQGRSFLGMGQREITDGRNNVFTVETYRQDFPYIGAPATVTVKQSSAGNAKTIQSVTHTYFHHVLAASAGNERFLPYRNGTVTKIHEVGGIKNGNLITEIIEGADVNTFGNTTEATVLVDDEDVGSPEFGSRWSSVTTTAYSEDETNWCIALPTSRSETRTPPGATAETRTTSWQFSGPQCRITQQTLEPNAGSMLSLITDVSYDACGNVDLLSSEPAGTTGQERETVINYGARCQRPETITNAEDHVNAFTYDWALGLPVTQTDPNGLVTTLGYDGFGRLTRQDRPDDTAVEFNRTACTAGNSWCGKNNSSARVRVTRTELNNTDSLLRTDEDFLDGLGRTGWTHRESLESGPAMVMSLYDAFNRPVSVTQPSYTDCNPVSECYWTHYDRDLIGRVIAIDAPKSETEISGRITGFAYEGRDLQVTDPGTFITLRRSNVLGQLRAITDPGTGGLTEYSYHPFGEVASIEDANGYLTSWTVNDRGFVTGTSDPDSGNWTYEINAFGEMTKIRDANTATGWTTQFTFDKLSRPKTRSEFEGTTTFNWGVIGDNTASNKYVGQLKSVTTSPGGYSESYLFDELSRISRWRTTISGTDYDFNYVYATVTGLLLSLEYPVSTGSSRFRIQFQYANNLLKRVKQYQTTPTYWEGNSTDAWGHYQDETLGNGIISITDFDEANGLMSSREAGVGGGTGSVNSIVNWNDLRGNLTQRQDLKLSPSVTEDFVNDSISRLDYSNRNGSENLNVEYYENGNIQMKDGQTYVYTRNATGCTYNFPHLQPRAVHKIGSTKYCYDANGNMTSRGGSTIEYTTYNLPKLINSGSNSSALLYGAFRNRFQQTAISGGTTETTLYVGGLFERVTRPGGTIEYRHYIPGGNGIAAILTRRSSGTNDTYYWHADHLGSPELFTDQQAVVKLRPSFGAFGERRDGTDWLGPPTAADLTAIANITRRGFTGHEHLDSVGLIHMNGRVYDPVAGRFLSVDPLLSVGLSQDVNAYSYGWNNPLNVVDPSGLSDVVINCIDACGYYAGGLDPQPGNRETYEPPAGAVIDNPSLAEGWVIKNHWDGQNGHTSRGMYGLGGSNYGYSAQFSISDPANELLASLKGRNLTPDLKIKDLIARGDWDGLKRFLETADAASEPIPANVRAMAERALYRSELVGSRLAQEAARHGFKKVAKDPPFNSHGQKVFTDGKNFLTRDVDSHSGGVWKMFDRAGRRIGTFDENLNKIAP